MFRRQIHTAPVRTPADVREELLSMCRHDQITMLNLSRHMIRDIGLDCGCDIPAGRALPFPNT